MDTSRVLLVLDPDSEALIEERAIMHHVWAIRSGANESAAHRVWARLKDQDQRGIEGGVTLFDPLPGTLEDMCVAILVDIDDHHNGYGLRREMTSLEVCGLELTPRIREDLTLRSFSVFELAPEGFVALRSARDSG